MVDKIKVALRIRHDKLDGDIYDTINAAKAELKRLGISPVFVDIQEPEADILEAVKTYCKYAYASSDKMRDGYFKSWEYQTDCLRKTQKMRGEKDV